MAAGRVFLALVLLTAPAAAQVTMNDNALDALGKPPVHRAAPHPAPAHSATRRPASTEKPASESKPAAPQPAAAAKPPSVPVTPPAILALPPPVSVPLSRPPPLPTIPLVADAAGQAETIRGGVRITFGPESADLNATTVAALQEFAGRVRDEARTSITISAYAAAGPDDASLPRRLALERALAARAVLVNSGIDSPRIYPRTIGPAPTGSPDRVDVISGPMTQPAAARGGAG